MLSIKTWEPSKYEAGAHSITFEVKRLGFTESKPFSVRYGRIRIDAAITARQKLARASEALNERGIAVLAAAAAAHGVELPARTDDSEKDLAAIGAALTAAGVKHPDIPADIERELTADLSAASREVGEADEVFYGSVDEAWLAQVFTDYVRNVAGLALDGVPVTTGAELLTVAEPGLVMAVLREVKRFSHLGGAEKNGSSSPSPSAPGAGEGGPVIAGPAESADSPRPATVMGMIAGPSCSAPVEEGVPV